VGNAAERDIVAQRGSAAAAAGGAIFSRAYCQAELRKLVSARRPK